MNLSVAAGSERSTILASHPEILASRRVNPFRYIRLGALLCLAGILAAGCIFSPEKSKGKVIPPPPIEFPPRDTPKNAVLYLTRAWSARDSVRIDSVYADEYTGTSNDATDPTAQNLTFVKSDEVRAVGALALSRTLTSAITMDFGLESGWFETQYVSDPPDWRVVQIPSFSITLNDSEKGEFSAKSPRPKETIIFEFALKPTYPNGPSGGQVWEIVRWTETRTTN